MNAAQLLRQKILDLAIRGKLTKREKGDEPAAELLARIAAEKQKLTAAKKIKKEKPLPPISEDEMPFVIPEGWKWVRLADITDSSLLNDGDWILSDDMVNDGPIKLLQLGSVGDGIYRNKGFKYLTEERFKALGCTEIHEGYLLVNRMIGDRMLACILPELEGRIITAVDVCWIAPSVRYHVKYLLYSVLSSYFQTAAKDFGAGDGRVRISKGNLKVIPFPLPPLAEQKRIVSRVEELLAEVDKYSAAMDALAASSEMMEKKVLDLAIRGKLTKREKGDEPAAELLVRIAAEKQKLIAAKKIKKEKPLPPITDDEKPFDIPEGWEWCRLGDVFQHNTGKALNKGKTDGKMRKYITTSNVYWDEFKIDDLREMPFTKDELDKCTIRKGDLLVCEGGDVGRAAIWNRDESVCIQNHLHRLRPYVEACVPYFCYIFRLYKVTNRLRGKGIALQGFSSGMLHNLLIPLPPLAEQKRIVARVDELLAECRKMRDE